MKFYILKYITVGIINKKKVKYNPNELLQLGYILFFPNIINSLNLVDFSKLPSKLSNVSKLIFSESFILFIYLKYFYFKKYGFI